MKIKLYIVTYDGKDHLNHNLETFFNSDFFKNYQTIEVDSITSNKLIKPTIEVTIINNHSRFYLDQKFHDKVKILHNTLRPDFSTGHLARNWNQAIINGFKDLKNPDCDWLIHCQDDTEWKANWFEILKKAMDKYTFYTSGNGDNVCCYTAEAVRNIGLWDERFCNIGYHEYDYFTRACIYNPDQSSINDLGDYPQNKQWNPEEPCTNYLPRDQNKNLHHNRSQQYHSLSAMVYKYKWGIPPEPRNFAKINQELKCTQNANFMFYPYFEKDIYSLKMKKYVVADPSNRWT